MKENLDLNVVDIKKDKFTEITLEPGKDLYIKNVTSKDLLILIEPKHWLDKYETFAKSLK